MLARHTEWSKRIHFRGIGKVPFAFVSEYWDPDPSNYEGWDLLRDRYIALGRKWTKRELAWRLSENLLDDVIHAAGGVETAVLRLRSLRDDAEAWVREHNIVASPGVPHNVANEYTVEAAYAFAELVTWTRAVIERLERPAFTDRKLRHQGLLPALRPKLLRRNVEALTTNLRAGPVGQIRNIANFNLHAALVRSPHSGMILDPSGAVKLPIPDAPRTPVAHWLLFEWTQDRTGLAVAEELWQILQDFIDALLTAFENAVPKRLQR
jgi:hypothetical protein